MEHIQISSGHLAAMPLHAITEMLGTEGLVRRLGQEISVFPLEGQHQINQAFLTANILHYEDRRVRERYINHLLRSAIRPIIYYGVTDANVISGCLLHDSVEDHHKELARGETGNTKVAALNTLERWFNPRVAQLVGAVTNPDFDPTRDKDEQYLEHLVKDIVEIDDPWPLIMKISDFTDNATGLIYTTGPKVKRLARVKYPPVVPILQKALETRTDLPISDSAIDHIQGQLELTARRLVLLAA